ncbi:unnamed protein product [Diabrotica balteata]|uniref:Uncharacterized protein n=1 Tax=Diabrotica balteata TaxID=107213 RepID=A0A9N9TAV9_DIABA|nr:unnamed protein product [Diabrotica balteata]
MDPKEETRLLKIYEELEQEGLLLEKTQEQNLDDKASDIDSVEASIMASSSSKRSFYPKDSSYKEILRTWYDDDDNDFITCESEVSQTDQEYEQPAVYKDSSESIPKILRASGHAAENYPTTTKTQTPQTQNAAPTTLTDPIENEYILLMENMSFTAPTLSTKPDIHISPSTYLTESTDFQQISHDPSSNKRNRSEIITSPQNYIPVNNTFQDAT